ncbi:ricin-type beta-trefoil lectin domain protein [Simiduia agarivorans]|uniref:Peptidase M60 domain-containing protein n=1 Tax=Simiduia agarivorans (strain DSM 21679 / JCM 13881 / BCRC 17597 / SA1) TaxID=1117647 RepID=K4L2E1_SIMAS|nr:ricin-type beta-trefoil lectin domain protein [Simiduia agarivorans]AFV00358.2 hypothetical protein M5M_16125 [Simiduia agarivorans SA1 = DSM 21679]
MNTHQLILTMLMTSGLTLAGCNVESVATPGEDNAAIEQPGTTETQPEHDSGSGQSPNEGQDTSGDQSPGDDGNQDAATPDADNGGSEDQDGASGGEKTEGGAQEHDATAPEDSTDNTPDEDPVDTPSSHPLHSAFNQSLCIAEPDNTLTAQACNESLQQRWLPFEGTLRAAWNSQLCVTATTLANGANVQLQTCNGDARQQWTYENNYLRNGNWALDLNRNTNAIIVYSFHGGDNQQWLTSANQSTPPPEAGWGAVEVPSIAPYGSRSFSVPAAQNWVNTGLYLRKGQTATISATGMWNVKGGELYGPDGASGEQSRGCQLGELTARIGLYYKDPAISCIGSSATFTAHEDGIVYMGSVVSNDLGEAYDTRTRATGSLTVTVESNGETVPTIAHNEAANYDFAAVSSGWIEIRSEHNIMTLPIATAIKDAGKLEAAGDRLDAFYKQHLALRGKAPYQGQAIRWFADTKDAPGWMLAGNPVRMDPALVDHHGEHRITLIADDGNNGWGFAHELGHDFNFAGGDWYYTSFGGLEAWPNIFTLHAIDKLGLPPRDLSDCADRKASYLAKNEHKDSLGDAWTGLCFLMEFQQAYGWDFYQRFYAKFNEHPGHGWSFLHQRFSEAAGEDVSEIFNGWNISY